jgi:integrase
MASIKQRPDGAWRARYRDAGGREHSKHFSRKMDAQKWLDQVTTAVVTGAYVDPNAGRITFTVFYEQWASRQVWAPGTRRAMALAAGSVPFSDLPLRSIRRSHVEQWIKAMSARNLAAGTIHTRTNNVRAVFRGAVADRLIPVDPSEGITLPRRRRAAAAMTIPTTAEVGRLIEAAHGPFKAFLGLCAFGGLRLGEAAGVQVADISFLSRKLVVSRQIQRENGGYQVRAPKYGSERTIYVAPMLVQMLTEHVRLYRPGDDSTRWLFTGEDDEPPHQNTHRTSVAGHSGQGQGREHPPPRSQALLRQRPDHPRMRRGNRAAGAGAHSGHNDPWHLLAPLANRRGPDSQCCGGHNERIPEDLADFPRTRSPQ